MSLNEIQDIIKIIEKLKAPSLDCLINRFLIIYSKHLVERIAALATICQDLGYFLARFKTAKSVVIPKINKTFKEKIYTKAQRPNAYLNIISQLFEKLPGKKLLLTAEECNLLPYPQMRNRKNRSTDITLVKLADYFYIIYNKGASASLHLLDISGAFDIINYTRLLNTL